MIGWIFRCFWGPSPGPAWMLICGLAAGFIFGGAAVGVNERYRFIETLTFSEVNLPKPVTPPPPGMRWAKVLTTGYCPCAICCAGSVDGKTAINRDVRDYPYGYATDMSLLPARIRLDIPGYGSAIVDDTGGAMRQAAKKGIIHIDLRFKDHQQARVWGRKNLWIAVPEDSGAARLVENVEYREKKK